MGPGWVMAEGTARAWGGTRGHRGIPRGVLLPPSPAAPATKTARNMTRSPGWQRAAQLGLQEQSSAQAALSPGPDGSLREFPWLGLTGGLGGRGELSWDLARAPEHQAEPTDWGGLSRPRVLWERLRPSLGPSPVIAHRRCGRAENSALSQFWEFRFHPLSSPHKGFSLSNVDQRGGSTCKLRFTAHQVEEASVQLCVISHHQTFLFKQFEKAKFKNPEKKTTKKVKNGKAR